MREKIREIWCGECVLRSNYCPDKKNRHCDVVDEALSAITDCICEEVEGMRKGKQGCVGFIEDEGDYNQALQDIIKEIRR